MSSGEFLVEVGRSIVQHSGLDGRVHLKLGLMGVGASILAQMLSRNQEVCSVGVGDGRYMYDVVVRNITFAIPSPDEFLVLLTRVFQLYHSHTETRFTALHQSSYNYKIMFGNGDDDDDDDDANDVCSVVCVYSHSMLKRKQQNSAANCGDAEWRELKTCISGMVSVAHTGLKTVAII